MGMGKKFLKTVLKYVGYSAVGVGVDAAANSLLNRGEASNPTGVLLDFFLFQALQSQRVR